MAYVSLDKDPSQVKSGQIIRQQFDTAVKSILTINNPEGHSFLLFIKRTLTQFKLNSFYDVVDVITEAYLRGIRLIETGVDIKNPPAWLRKTAFNIIREYSRLERKTQPLAESHLNSQSLKANTPSDVAEKLDKQLKIIWEALDEIPKEDFELLKLRYFENKSWKEISANLTRNQAQDSDINALRTRGSRAMKRLRQKYYAATNK